jgi:hypothetical protein
VVVVADNNERILLASRHAAGLSADRFFLTFVLAVTELTSFWTLEIPFLQEVLLRGDGEGKLLAAFLAD